MKIIPAGSKFGDQYDSVLLGYRKVLAKANFSLVRLISPGASVKRAEDEQPLWRGTESRSPV